MSGVLLEEVEGLMAFTSVTTDITLVSTSTLATPLAPPLIPSQQEELLNILRNLLLKSECGRELGQAMWTKGDFLLSLIRAPSMPVRLIVIKVSAARLLSENTARLARLLRKNTEKEY